jgi:putative transposase
MAARRDVEPDGLYHVMSRGNFRQPIFVDDDHYVAYLRRLTIVVRRRHWIVLDWCLMPNHYHLVLQLTDGGLSEGMRELNSRYSRWSNEQLGRTGTGHLFQNRFRSKPLTTDGHLWETFRYVPNNPVMADLESAPENWKWSGYRAAVGLEHPRVFHRPTELLRYFGDKPATACERYRQFVLDGLVRAGRAPWSDQDGSAPT